MTTRPEGAAARGLLGGTELRSRGPGHGGLHEARLGRNTYLVLKSYFSCSRGTVVRLLHEYLHAFGERP